MNIPTKSILTVIALAFVGTTANAEGDLAKFARKKAPGILKEMAMVGCGAKWGPQAGEGCREGMKEALALPPPGRPYHSQQNQPNDVDYQQPAQKQYSPPRPYSHSEVASLPRLTREVCPDDVIARGGISVQTSSGPACLGPGGGAYYPMFKRSD